MEAKDVAQIEIRITSQTGNQQHFQDYIFVYLSDKDLDKYNGKKSGTIQQGNELLGDLTTAIKKAIKEVKPNSSH